MKTPLLTGLFLVAVPVLSAQTLFTDSFDSLGAFETIADSGGTVAIQTDTGNVFGGGMSNSYLEISEPTDVGSGVMVARNEAAFGPQDGVAFSFDLFDASGASSNNFYFRIGNGTLGSGERWDVVFNDGTVSVGGGVADNFAYTQDTVNGFTFVFNSGASAFDWDGTSVAPQTYNAYLNGSLAFTGAAGTTSTGNAAPIDAYSWLMIAGQGGADGYWVDNFSATVAPVPEASTFGLFAGILALGLTVLRRRKAKKSLQL